MNKHILDGTVSRSQAVRMIAGRSKSMALQLVDLLKVVRLEYYASTDTCAQVVKRRQRLFNNFKTYAVALATKQRHSSMHQSAAALRFEIFR